MTLLHSSLDSPVGPLTVTEEDGALISLEWRKQSNGSSSQLLDEARRQLDAYFARTLTKFDLPVRPVPIAQTLARTNVSKLTNEMMQTQKCVQQTSLTARTQY